MIPYETDLFRDRWRRFSLAEQMANIGSEVARADRHRQGCPQDLVSPAAERALALIDLTLGDPRWRTRLKEIARAREIFVDALYGSTTYGASLGDIDRYFLPFAVAARIKR